MQKQLEGKIAIITGGASGIGKATAARFLEAGAAVAIWDIDVARMQALHNAWAMPPSRLRCYPVNTADYEAVANAARQVAQDFGAIHILVNNAGITRDSTLKKMSLEQWQQVMDVNLSGVFHCTKAVLPYLEAQGWGRILNAASVVGIHGNFGQTNYAAAKAGVIGMTKVWARELGRKGITVNAVAPGFIQTEMMDTVPAATLQALRDKTPVPRIGQPEDIAAAYAFLASDDAGFINGAVLSIDGGLTM